jgi:hypothetical protein
MEEWENKKLWGYAAEILLILEGISYDKRNESNWLNEIRWWWKESKKTNCTKISVTLYKTTIKVGVIT